MEGACEREGGRALPLPLASTIERVSGDRSAEEAEQGGSRRDHELPELPILPKDNLLHGSHPGRHAPSCAKHRRGFRKWTNPREAAVFPARMAADSQPRTAARCLGRFRRGRRIGPR
jgi:hypothetical protein